MVKHSQTIRRLLLTNCLSVFDHVVGLVLKGLTFLYLPLSFLKEVVAANFNTRIIRQCDKNIILRVEWMEMNQMMRNTSVSCRSFILPAFAILLVNKFSKCWTNFWEKLRLVEKTLWKDSIDAVLQCVRNVSVGMGRPSWDFQAFQSVDP